MADITATYMGMKLRSPLVVSANPLSQRLDNILAMEDAGAGAVVLFSLFEEQIRREAEVLESISKASMNFNPEALEMFPEHLENTVSSVKYLELVRRAKERASIPIIASLNGTTTEGWIEHARDLEHAGADALEVNIYFIPGDVQMTSDEVEQRYVDIVKLLRDTIDIPIAVKLSPYFSSIGNMAGRLADAGADALVLFNRFYQPDYDIYERKVIPSLDLSTPAEIRLPLLWIAVLYGRIPASLAATTGIHSAEQLIKYLLAGADVGMCASILLQNGIGEIRTILNGLALYMNDMPFASLDAFRGSMSQKNIPDPTDYERNNYIQVLGANKWARRATGRP
ncbi:MAG: dihydroorotate dehydrogenase-like protein [Pyrinomonadaceae bacterium]|nr:dihydroorotate dehydrogenase-like protein [Pyrinomonadaceae bacterium]